MIYHIPSIDLMICVDNGQKEKAIAMIREEFQENEYQANMTYDFLVYYIETFLAERDSPKNQKIKYGME